MSKWIGEEPAYCDVCNRKITSAFVDGKIQGAGWCVMCTPCHKVYGVGLGVGRGQLYKKNTGEWASCK